MKNKLVFSGIEKEILDTIEKNGGKVYIVGGLVRDLVLYKQVDYHDVDVEVYNLTMSKLQEILSMFGHVDEIGKSFGILKINTLPTFDFALPRIETKTGKGHIDFDVTIDQNLDLLKATSRRDLTMNALLYEYSSDTIIDLHNGITDIQHSCIKMVNPKTFKEDPLRVYRIAQFASRFEFYVDSKTKQYCREMVKEGLLKSLSQERVYEEYCKLLMSLHPSIGLLFLRDIGALPNYLAVLEDTIQRQDYHPEGNVMNHVLLVMDIAALVKDRTSNPLGFMWSCLFHDLGKPLVTTSDGHAPKHNEAGVEVFNQYCTTLICNTKLQKYIRTMIFYHMHLMNMARNKARDIAYLRVLKGIDGILPIMDLILISKCDKLGRLRDCHESVIQLDEYINDLVDRLGTTARKPIITGTDVLALGNKETRQFKEILDDAYELQLRGKNKEQILEYIKKEY